MSSHANGVAAGYPRERRQGRPAARRETHKSRPARTRTASAGQSSTATNPECRVFTKAGLAATDAADRSRHPQISRAGLPLFRGSDQPCADSAIQPDGRRVGRVCPLTLSVAVLENRREQGSRERVRTGALPIYAGRRRLPADTRQFGARIAANAIARLGWR